MTPPARLSKPVDKLVNEAVGEYVQSRTAELEANSTGMLDRVKAVGPAQARVRELLGR